MDTHWEQINSIQMSLHRSELILNHTKNHKEISIVKLDEHDVIRHQLVKTIINAFNEK